MDSAPIDAGSSGPGSIRRRSASQLFPYVASTPRAFELAPIRTQLRRLVSVAIGALAAALLTFPCPGFAGPLDDFDGDLVPVFFDNCRSVANGPNQLRGSNQSDSDGDGYGNRCDTDFDQSGTTTSADFGRLLADFGESFCVALFPPPIECVVDLDGSGTITVSDFAIFLGRFSAPPGGPGPSGLACARYAIRIDLGEAPCAP